MSRGWVSVRFGDVMRRELVTESQGRMLPIRLDGVEKE